MSHVTNRPTQSQGGRNTPGRGAWTERPPTERPLNISTQMERPLDISPL
jgi:hypothetical protein